MVLFLRRPLSGLILGSLLSLACGNGDDLDPVATEEIYSPPVAEVVEEEVVSTPPVTPAVEENTPEEMLPEEMLPEERERCATPDRVSGSPNTIPAALILMNALPRPTTLECFIESLERPLSVYLTSSGGSLQPSLGARSPRTFIVNGDLVMSIVFDGEAAQTLELGYRTSPERSIKTEILFPLERDITLNNLFDRVETGSVTMCGACHTGEIFTNHVEFPDGVYESAVIVPSSVFTVDLESLRAEEAECDPATESARCGLLDSFFDHGEVQTSLQWPGPGAL